MSDIINIGKNREMFWDTYLLDEDKTTASFRICPPVYKDTCFIFDHKSEKAGISYPCIVKDEKGYKMYYIAHGDDPEVYPPQPFAAVIESPDGINWEKPALNIFDLPNFETNNVVMKNLWDSASFFYDQNPDCPKDEKYKAIAKAKELLNGEEKEGLWCYTSADGYNFKASYFLSDNGYFDSLNTIVWDNGQYSCFFRGFHNIIPGGEISWATRDVRVMHSKDFKNWTEPKMIEFDDELDLALYTNNAIPYERAPQYIIGFPTRYFERKGWTENIKQMPSFNTKKVAADRQALQVDRDRTGLVNTDCIFMFSRDGGDNWHRYNEAFMTPGYEHSRNWIYGDCYPAYSFIDSGNDSYYMYEVGWHLSYDDESPLYRYEIVKDRFACIAASDKAEMVVTKPIIFEGKDLYLNFSTSAYGYIYVDVLDEAGNEISGKSFEIYGDTIDRKISFEDGSDFSAFSGKPVRLRFKMLDSKLYSMKFE